MDANEYNAWAASFLWPFNMPDECPVKQLEAASDACVEWVREFQEETGLLVDGYLGPSTLHACAATWDGPGLGVGQAIIGGVEVDIGVPVARMGTLDDHSGFLTEEPELGVVTTCSDLERLSRDRRARKKALVCHFSVDASRGRDGRSLILQWADPAMQVPFVPVDEADLYPAGRQAVGVELENPLLPHYADREAKAWRRRRERVVREVQGRNARQLDLFPEQIEALKALIAALTEHLGIESRFPVSEGVYDTGKGGDRGGWKGWLAHFNVGGRGAPGAGFVAALPELFGALQTSGEGPVDRSGEPSKDSDIGVRTYGPPAEEQSGGQRIDALQPVEEQERDDEQRDAAWAVEEASPLAPRSVNNRPFSLSSNLRKRGRSRSTRSRADALRRRLGGGSDGSDD